MGVQHGTVQNWLRGGVPGVENLRKIGEVFGVDPNDFLAEPFDMLFSHSMTLAYKIFLKEQSGDYDVKITLSGLVRLLEKLGVFREPADAGLDLPESALQSILPQLEERARAEAQVMALADANFLKNFVSEHRERIEELLSDDPDLTSAVPTSSHAPTPSTKHFLIDAFLPFSVRQARRQSFS